MNKENKNAPTYEPPKLEVLEIMVEQAVLQASGYGPDSDDSEFGLYDPSMSLEDLIGKL